MTTKLTPKFEAFAREFDKLSIDGKRAVYLEMIYGTDTWRKRTITQVLAEVDARFPRS